MLPGDDPLKGVEPVALDPEGLFKNVNGGGHFARREAQRAAKPTVVEPEFAPYDEASIVRLPEHLAKEGLPTGQDASWEGGIYSKEAFARMLADKYMPVNLDEPGARLHNLEPPVFTFDACMDESFCDQLRDQSTATNRLKASQIGEQQVGQGAASERRTSSTLLVEPQLLASHPELTGTVGALHARIREILPGGAWDKTGYLPGPGRFCFESAQVCRYTEGQHFLSHEDAFPADIAERNQFQRRATFLVYLNDVPEGGGTHFDHIGITIQPRKGRAMMFFPGMADGTNDPRTLHTAQPAVGTYTKWITQQWVAWGLPPMSARIVDQGLVESEDFEQRVLGKKKKGGKRKDQVVRKQQSAARGFG